MEEPKKIEEYECFGCGKRHKLMSEAQECCGGELESNGPKFRFGDKVTIDVNNLCEKKNLLYEHRRGVIVGIDFDTPKKTYRYDVQFPLKINGEWDNQNMEMLYEEEIFEDNGEEWDRRDNHIYKEPHKETEGEK